MAGEGASSGGLVCPACGVTHPDSERFCRACGMPLVREATHSTAPDARQLRARKIKPQLGEGELVRVAGARNQAEAEFIQGMLLEEGVPSLIRRSAGFDVPDFLAAGPRDLLVPASGVATAREVLLEAEVISDAPASTGPDPMRLLAGLLAALLIGAVVVWLGTMLLSR